jgi:hypothetical protein
MEIMKLAFEAYLYTLQSNILHAVKSYDMIPMVLLPLRKRRFADFYRPKNSSSRPGLNPREPETTMYEYKSKP